VPSFRGGASKVLLDEGSDFGRNARLDRLRAASDVAQKCLSAGRPVIGIDVGGLRESVVGWRPW
jgi:hypothetical protein